MTQSRMRRSRDQLVAGVCGGLAEYFRWDPALVRIIYALVTVFSAAFPGLVVYLILWLVMPGPEEESV